MLLLKHVDCNNFLLSVIPDDQSFDPWENAPVPFAPLPQYKVDNKNGHYSIVAPNGAKGNEWQVFNNGTEEYGLLKGLNVIPGYEQHAEIELNVTEYKIRLADVMLKEWPIRLANELVDQISKKSEHFEDYQDEIYRFMGGEREVIKSRQHRVIKSTEENIVTGVLVYEVDPEDGEDFDDPVFEVDGQDFETFLDTHDLDKDGYTFEHDLIEALCGDDIIEYGYSTVTTLEEWDDPETETEYIEYFQFFIVDSSLQYWLGQTDETVIDDYFGLPIWGRQCCGQSVSCDGVIQDIAIQHYQDRYVNSLIWGK